MTSLYGSGLLGSGGNVVPNNNRPGAHGLRTRRPREAPSLPVSSLLYAVYRAWSVLRRVSSGFFKPMVPALCIHM